MSHATQRLVHDFEALSEAERQEVLAELLRRAASEPHDSPDEDDLVAAADQAFQQLDRGEKEQ